MFIGTMWALMQRHTNSVVSRRMTVVACSLLLLGTTHMVIDIIRIEEGPVQQRDTLPGDPAAFFSDVTQWSFVYKNMLYMLQTLAGDGVVIYRCYVVWQSFGMIIIPLILIVGRNYWGRLCIPSPRQRSIRRIYLHR
ncbi:hypothetical protein PAXRUDRAFT_718212 [Paxillus rubicundulus Ve08.2h10]|uniref:Unplaced genomic scaffold scaffold_810, whole genome shotgun sequence n=1 Tax=Paxillus rubicundulus Ve08.2h10 TaxID=930991 RepID=A0A0D0CI84_9AGAM|nr:hypothetical protein PAXRUDRAFT_718212 [Paxillus rubicundulus Ve08.2h10]